MAELRLHLNPSKRLAAFLAAVHLIALFAAWTSALAWWWCLAASVGVVLSAVISWRRYWRGVPGFLSYRSGQWYLQWSGEAEARPAALVGEYLVSPWLVVLQFLLADGKRYALVLPPDCANAEDLRRLRVVLRYGLEPA